MLALPSFNMVTVSRWVAFEVQLMVVLRRIKVVATGSDNLASTHVKDVRNPKHHMVPFVTWMNGT